MAHYAHLAIDLGCPACGSLVTDLIWFPWGFSASYSPIDEHLYRLGDAIRWKTCRDGHAPAWTYFWREVTITFKGQHFTAISEEANLGDPAVTDLIVVFPYPEDQCCAACNQQLGGTAVEIRDARIRRAWVYRSGEFSDEQVDIYLIAGDGSLIPKPEWYFHSMDRLSADQC
jgi:hypothetical protein